MTGVYTTVKLSPNSSWNSNYPPKGGLLDERGKHREFINFEVNKVKRYWRSLSKVLRMTVCYESLNA